MRKAFVIKGLVVSLVFLMIAVSGCGASKAAQTSAGDKNVTNQDTKAPETALERIKREGKLTMAMGGKYPPFNFFNDSNQLAGFDVEIGAEIAKRLGVKPETTTIEWDGMIPGLMGKKYDMIMASMAITPERLTKINFSDPYYRSGAQIFVPGNSTIKSAEDLKGKVVGVGLGTTYEKKAGELGANAKTYKSTVDALQDMKIGRVQAVIGDKLVTQYANIKNNYGYKLVGDMLYTENEGIGIRKEDTDLLAAVNKALTDMKADGTYEKISMKWFKMDIR